MGSFPYPFNSVPSDLTQAASWLQSNFQDAADTAYVDAEIAAASLATAAGVQANLDAHIADSTDAHDASAISVVDTGGYYSSTDVEGALQEAGADTATVASGLAAHLADAVDAHDASAISILDVAGDFTATDVEGALAELQSDAETDAAALAAHLADTTDAHDASAISILDTASDFTATDVEGALAELQSDREAHEAETTTAHGGIYTQTQSNARFVNTTGDVMTGDLAIVEGSNAVVLSADSIQFGAGTESAGAEWGLDLYGTGIWGGAAVDSLDVGFERLTPGVLSITSGDDLDMRPGVLYVDTQTPADNSEKAASTAYVDAAVTAGASLTITESGIIIPSGVTTVQHALRNVEAYVQNLEERFEQHHHDDRFQKQIACRVYANVVGNIVTVPATTVTVIPFNSEVFDTANLHDTSTNNSRIYLPKVGLWEIGANLYMLPSTGYLNASDIYILLARNGAYDLQTPVASYGAVNGYSVVPGGNASTIIQTFDDNDYFEVAAYSDVTATQVFGVGGVNQSLNTAWARYLGPA